MYLNQSSLTPIADYLGSPRCVTLKLLCGKEGNIICLQIKTWNNCSALGLCHHLQSFQGMDNESNLHRLAAWCRDQEGGKRLVRPACTLQAVCVTRPLLARLIPTISRLCIHARPSIPFCSWRHQSISCRHWEPAAHIGSVFVHAADHAKICVGGC